MKFPPKFLETPAIFMIGAASLMTLPALPLGAQTVEWIWHKTEDGRHPDENEQQLVWLMNRARSNPTVEGQFLANSGDPGIASGVSYFRVDTNLLKSEFAGIAAKPPAAFDRRIYEGSRAHSLDLIARNTQDHNNQFARVGAAGFKYGNSSRASVFAYARAGLECHGALNIDWGQGPGGMQQGRGHRLAIMSAQPDLLTNVGFAMVPETNPNTQIGPFVFSGAYCSVSPGAADHFSRFLVGTVWTDANGNSRYDPGEGIDKVRIQPDKGTFHAVTGVGGGWAIPATVEGDYQLTFSGGTLQGSVVRTATVRNVSVLVDLPYIQPPPAMEVTFRAEADGTLTLGWSGGRPPYQVQETPDLATPWRNRGAPVQGNSVTLPPTGPRAFYRVASAP